MSMSKEWTLFNVFPFFLGLVEVARFTVDGFSIIGKTVSETNGNLLFPTHLRENCQVTEWIVNFTLPLLKLSCDRH